jgi:large subunit ribosomal protein L25
MEMYMSENFQLTAVVRERAGKGNARATRKEGRIPAVIYGDNKSPVMVSLDTIPLIKALHTGQFFTHLCEVNVDGQKHTVLARDVQMHPVKDHPEHVDFLRVGAKTQVTVEVPVHFINQDKSSAIRKGGVLNLVLHTLSIRARADKIPTEIEFDLSSIEDFGTVIKVSDLKLPTGSTAAIEDDSTVASIAAPSSSEETTEAAPAEEAKK